MPSLDQISGLFTEDKPTASPGEEQEQKRLSYILQNCLFLEIVKECPQCSKSLLEEEVLSGMLKN